MTTTAHMFPHAPEPPGDIVPVLKDIAAHLQGTKDRGGSRLCYEVPKGVARCEVRDAINDCTDVHGWVCTAPANRDYTLRIRAAWEGK